MRHQRPGHGGGEATTCVAAEEWILEADTGALRRGPGGELGRHLGGCARCRDLVRRVLAGQKALSLQLQEASRGADVEEMLLRVRTEIAAAGRSEGEGGSHEQRASTEDGEGKQADAGATGKGRGRAAARWRRVARVAVPLAAAAALVAVVLWPSPPRASGGPETEGGGPESSLGVPTVPLGGGGASRGGGGRREMVLASRPSRPELGVSADRPFAVMKTGEPGISVVWFY